MATQAWAMPRGLARPIMVAVPIITA